MIVRKTVFVYQTFLKIFLNFDKINKHTNVVDQTRMKFMLIQLLLIKEKTGFIIRNF